MAKIIPAALLPYRTFRLLFILSVFSLYGTATVAQPLTEPTAHTPQGALHNRLIRSVLAHGELTEAEAIQDMAAEAGMASPEMVALLASMTPDSMASPDQRARVYEALQLGADARLQLESVMSLPDTFPAAQLYKKLQTLANETERNPCMAPEEKAALAVSWDVGMQSAWLWTQAERDNHLWGEDSSRKKKAKRMHKAVPPPATTQSAPTDSSTAAAEKPYFPKSRLIKADLWGGLVGVLGGLFTFGGMNSLLHLPLAASIPAAVGIFLLLPAIHSLVFYIRWKKGKIKGQEDWERQDKERAIEKREGRVVKKESKVKMHELGN